MNKNKLIIASTTAVMLSLSGFLAFHLVTGRQQKPTTSGTASAMTVPAEDIIHKNQKEENSGKYTYIPPVFEYDDNKSNEEVASMEDYLPIESKTPWAPATKMDLDPTSITVFVNKEYALPKDYVPEDLVIPNVLFDLTGYDERKLLRREAATALEQLFQAAQADGYTLYGISGYRSYDRQKQIFLNNIVKKGKKHTLKYSAVPGTSEHQTGLAIDVSTKALKFRLVTTFANSPEGKWLAENAHYYGYIVRYPKNRSDITGYAYEPWHIRYVGKDLAKYLYDNNLTLDEYYHYTPGEGFDFEALYADLINYVPPVTPAPPEEVLEPVPGDLDGDGIVDDLDGDGLPDYVDEELPAEEEDETDSEDKAAPEKDSAAGDDAKNPENEKESPPTQDDNAPDTAVSEKPPKDSVPETPPENSEEDLELPPENGTETPPENGAKLPADIPSETLDGTVTVPEQGSNLEAESAADIQE